MDHLHLALYPRYTRVYSTTSHAFLLPRNASRSTMNTMQPTGFFSDLGSSLLIPPSHRPPKSPILIPVDEVTKTPGSGHTEQPIGQPEHPLHQALHHVPHTLAQWHSLVRETLVEVVDQSGNSVVIARHLLAKSQSNNEKDYEYALKYIVKLLHGEEHVDEFVKKHPKLKLHAWFEELPVPNRVGAGHYVDIDPNSWSEVWSFADRICVVY